jgi:hypothetical protein
MIHSETYLNYRGPPLIKAVIGDKNITEQLKVLYGENYNWNGCLWTYKEAFGKNSINKNFRLDFKGGDGRDHWFHGFITDLNQYFNPPMATPINQNL